MSPEEANRDEYTDWFSLQMIGLVEALTSNDQEKIRAYLKEIQRGISYEKKKPHVISKVLISVASKMLPEAAAFIEVTPSPSAPSVTTPVVDVRAEREDRVFSVDELKTKLETRKKKKVLGEMSGSLDLLKDAKF